MIRMEEQANRGFVRGTKGKDVKLAIGEKNSRAVVVGDFITGQGKKVTPCRRERCLVLLPDNQGKMVKRRSCEDCDTVHGTISKLGWLELKNGSN